MRRGANWVLSSTRSCGHEPTFRLRVHRALSKGASMAETATTASARRHVGAQVTLTDADTARRDLVATMPVVERRLELAGISTAVLEGGAGDPIVLLHGPM